MSDNRGGGDYADFEEFANSGGGVQVGESNLASQDGDQGGKDEGGEAKPPKAPAKRGAGGRFERSDQGKAPADEAGAGNADEGGENGGNAGDEGGAEGGEDDDGDEGQQSRRQHPSERIRELNKRLRQSERLRLADAERISALEAAMKNPTGQAGGGGGNTDAIGDAPNPADAAKYPLGHLDDRYIEDKLEWLSTKKAAERADAALHRQQEDRQRQSQEQAQSALREKVDDLALRGTDLHDDYQEVVVDTAMRGDWPLTQQTFEAAHEVDHGAQILYELATNPKEAKRVAGLSTAGQVRYVDARNAELTAKAKGRTRPGGNPPPSRNQPSGGNSRTRINPATDNLEDFEKAWEADAKGK